MLIKTFEEVRLHFSDATDNNFDNLLPFLKRAKRKILKIIPEDLYNIALQHYNIPEDIEDEDSEMPEEAPEETETTEPTDEQIETLIEHIQSCLVYYAFYLRHPLNNAMLTENGWQQTWNDNVRPLKYEDSKELRKEILFLFHDSVEALIEFLNLGYFEQWNESTFKLESQKTLFRNAADFSKYVAIDDSARFFYLLLPEIITSSKYLTNELKAKYEELRTSVHANNVADADIELLDECRYYSAYFAISKIVTKVALEDVPACLHGISYDNKQRDMFSLTYTQNADVKIKTIAAYMQKLLEPEITNPYTPVKSSPKSKHFSM